MINEEDKIFELDKLQLKLRRKSVIEIATSFLEKENIDKKFTRTFLISEMFVKFPELFTDISEYLSEISCNVFNQINLNENLPILYDLIIDLKKKDIEQLNADLYDMKVKTRASSNDAENENCNECYEIQGKIIDVAKNFFDKLD